MTFSINNQGAHAPSEYIFENLQVLPWYNLIQNRIGFMMYKLHNDFIPNISEICMVNNCMIILRDNLIFYILEHETIMYLFKTSITLVLEFGIRYKKRLTFLFPLNILKQHYFPRIILSNWIVV